MYSSNVTNVTVSTLEGNLVFVQVIRIDYIVRMFDTLIILDLIHHWKVLKLQVKAKTSKKDGKRTDICSQGPMMREGIKHSL